MTQESTKKNPSNILFWNSANPNSIISPRRINFILGIAVFLSIELMGRIEIGSIDAFQRIALTKAIVTEGRFVTDEYGAIKYPPAQSIIMILPYSLGYGIGRIMGRFEEKCLRLGKKFCRYLFNPLIFMLIVLLSIKLIHEMSGSFGTAIITSLITSYSSLLLPHSKYLFSEMLSALCLIGASCGYLNWRKSGSHLSLMQIYMSLTVMALNNYLFILILTALSSLHIGFCIRRKTNIVRVSAYVALSHLIVISILLGYNFIRYQNPFTFGYEAEQGFSNNFIIGLYGLLFSFGRGFLIYSAITALCLIIFVFRYERFTKYREIYLINLFLFALFLCIYAKWHSFEGGWCWGPRFLLPFIPILNISFFLLARNFRSQNFLIKIILVIGVMFGLCLNAIDNTGLWWDFELANFDKDYHQYMLNIFHPKHSSILNSFSVKVGYLKFFQFFVVSGILFLFATSFVISRLKKIRLSNQSPERVKEM